MYITAVYFLGVLVSRIGRVLQSIIENWKNKKSILYIKFVPESDYIKAEKIDPKIQIISMESHFNRSLVGLFLTFTIIYTLDKVFLIINDSAPSMANYLLSLFIIFILLTLLALFYYSWKRQEAHVEQEWRMLF